MNGPNRGEVWLVDLGLAAKTRPCVVLSIPATGQNDRVLVTGIWPLLSSEHTDNAPHFFRFFLTGFTVSGSREVRS